MHTTIEIRSHTWLKFFIDKRYAITQQPQLHPHSGPQTPHQTPLPLAQGALQCTATRCRASRVTGCRQKDPQASGAASAPWSLLSVWERQCLGGQQDQSHRHLRQGGDSATQREYQQCQQEAVLLWDDVSQRLLRRLWLFGNWRQTLELLLHQLAHVCTSADFIWEPGGVEAHSHQRSLCVCAESQVVEAVKKLCAHRTHTGSHTQWSTVQI